MVQHVILLSCSRKRQLAPTHYYGSPSAGWGGFQSGHTGTGWDVPKKD